MILKLFVYSFTIGAIMFVFSFVLIYGDILYYMYI